MFAPLNPKGMGPMTPPLTLALNQPDGDALPVSTAVYATNPTQPRITFTRLIHRLW